MKTISKKIVFFVDGVKKSIQDTITMIANPSKPTAAQLSVGTCPVCGAIPDWFNNVPLTAYCWGTEEKPHNEARRIVPSPYQPYADSFEFKRTRWVVEKKRTF